ncbi:hypothetical protein UFOVP330_90 [uncultured Caudovirales phage]|uniref:Uncharacterized protein n=1 Tax=uncultured Caudovirales phage TaxID=2100421 RepID=A0A6J5LZ81_9CAUD|nr:hypothetical protein UFOVP330_90 [uncultured Caudovirales phage]
MKYMIEKAPMPDSEADLGPKQRTKILRSLGPDECLTLDLTDEVKPERFRNIWVVTAHRADIPVRSRMIKEPDGRVLLRIWRVVQTQ